MKKINVGVIGLGWVASNRHIPIIMRNSQIHLFGVVDKNKNRIESILQKYPWVRTSVSEKGEIPWLEQVDAFLIATDPLSHFHLAKRMLLSQKNILIEKPVTVSLRDALEIKQIATENKLICCASHNFQFARSTTKLKEMIDNGKLGKILGVEVTQWSNPKRRLPSWYEELPFGLYYDESPHVFYLLKHLLSDDIEHLSSSIVTQNSSNTPLTITALYQSNGIPVRLNMNFHSSLSEWHIAFLGSKQVAILDLFRDILVTVPNDGYHKAKNILSTTYSFTMSHLLGFFRSGISLTQKKLFYGSDIVWDKFVTGILNGKQPDDISIDNALDTVQLQHEIMTKSSIFESSLNENSSI